MAPFEFSTGAPQVRKRPQARSNPSDGRNRRRLPTEATDGDEAARAEEVGGEAELQRIRNEIFQLDQSGFLWDVVVLNAIHQAFGEDDGAAESEAAGGDEMKVDVGGEGVGGEGLPGKEVGYAVGDDGEAELRRIRNEIFQLDQSGFLWDVAVLNAIHQAFGEDDGAAESEAAGGDEMEVDVGGEGDGGGRRTAPLEEMDTVMVDVDEVGNSVTSAPTVPAEGDEMEVDVGGVGDGGGRRTAPLEEKDTVMVDADEVGNSVTSAPTVPAEGDEMEVDVGGEGDGGGRRTAPLEEKDTVMVDADKVGNSATSAATVFQPLSEDKRDSLMTMPPNMNARRYRNMATALARIGCPDFFPRG